MLRPVSKFKYTSFNLLIAILLLVVFSASCSDSGAEKVAKGGNADTNDGTSPNVNSNSDTPTVPKLPLWERICRGDEPAGLLTDLTDESLLKHYDFSNVDTLNCRYVSSSGSVSNDGTSWAKAWDVSVLRNPASEITDASATNIYLLLVKEGTYKPTDNSSNREASFVMTSGVFIIGGFSGNGFNSGGETILNGDLNDDDESSEPDGEERKENSLQVVTANSVNPLMLSNVNITGGYADGSNDDGSGGGLYAYYSETVLAKVILTGNFASKGGGSYVNSGSISIYSSEISGNIVGSTGGGIHIETTTYSVLRDSVIKDNRAYNGAGLYLEADAEISGTLIMNNDATFTGGGISMENNYLIKIISSIIQRNTADQNGGAIYNKFSNFYVINSLIIENSTNLESSSDIYLEAENYSWNDYKNLIFNSVLWNQKIYSLTHSADNFKLRIGYSIIENQEAISTDNQEYNYLSTAISNNDPSLMPLADNGGPVHTRAITDGSSAENTGTFIGFDKSGNLCFVNNPSDSTAPNWVRADSEDYNSLTACSGDIEEIIKDGRGYGIVGRPDIGSYEYDGKPREE